MKETSAILDHVKLIESKNEKKIFQVRNIDFIYLINLDIRTDRLKRCMDQFAPFAIYPHRVPGINGWAYTQEVFDAIAMKLLPSMQYDKPVHFKFVPGGARGTMIDASCYGKPCVHSESPAGGLGGAMAHLSILYDAQISDYQIVWILEDDITVKGNPHFLANYIDRLDQCVGRDNWDVLYTDDDCYFTAENVHSHLGKGPWIRPGMLKTEALIERKAVGDDFFKIGGRTQAHSVIYSRSGITKIVDYLTKNHFFLPYDTELPCIDGLNMFNLKYDVVHGRDRSYSDTYVKRI